MVKLFQNLFGLIKVITLPVLQCCTAVFKTFYIFTLKRVRC